VPLQPPQPQSKPKPLWIPITPTDNVNASAGYDVFFFPLAIAGRGTSSRRDFFSEREHNKRSFPCRSIT
jgi:hypothetical protein